MQAKNRGVRAVLDELSESSKQNPLAYETPTLSSTSNHPPSVRSAHFVGSCVYSPGVPVSFSCFPLFNTPSLPLPYKNKFEVGRYLKRKKK